MEDRDQFSIERDKEEEAYIIDLDIESNKCFRQYMITNDGEDEEKYNKKKEDETEKKHEVNVINNIKAIKKAKNKEEASTRARTSFIFALEDENGKQTQYLGLLDTECTGSLISAELAERYNMKQKMTTGNGVQTRGNSQQANWQEQRISYFHRFLEKEVC